MAILARLHVEICILIFCAIILMGTGQTRGPVFDVVGPDFLPTAVAIIVGLLVLLQVVVQVIGDIRQAPPPIRLDAGALRRALLFSIATGFFVAALAYRVLPLYLASSLFVACSTMLLSNRPGWRDALFGALSGLLLGAILQYVFTQILFIDLTG